MQLPEHSILGSTRLGALVARGQRIARARLALMLAIILHLIAVAILPAFPKIELAAIKRSVELNIFLNRPDKEQPFEQELNQEVPSPDATQPLLEPLLGSASSTSGKEEDVSEETVEAQSPATDGFEKEPSGAEKTTSIQPALRITRSMINLFARQEAAHYAREYPDKIEDFRRTFNSRQNFRRRNKVASYKNRYGDYYVRSSTSAGDICYKLKRESLPQEFATNTVDFFRCDSEPIKLDIDSKG